jgi:nucleoid-associated protein YgaU
MSLGELGAITAEIGQMTLEEQAEEVPEDFWDGEGYMPEDWWEDEDEWGPEIDEEDFDPWAKEPEPEPDGWVAPAPVPIRPNRWDLSTKPARYQVVWGDTLAGLAATYLHDGGRWREIWNLQPGEYTTTRTPDAIFVNDWLNMPQEAVDTLKAHTKKTGEKIPGETDWTPWIVGGALLVAAGGAAYAFSR